MKRCCSCGAFEHLDIHLIEHAALKVVSGNVPGNVLVPNVGIADLPFTPLTPLHIRSSDTPQLRIDYDATYNVTFTTQSDGDLVVTLPFDGNIVRFEDQNSTVQLEALGLQANGNQLRFTVDYDNSQAPGGVGATSYQYDVTGDSDNHSRWFLNGSLSSPIMDLTRLGHLTTSGYLTAGDATNKDETHTFHGRTSTGGWDAGAKSVGSGSSPYTTTNADTLIYAITGGGAISIVLNDSSASLGTTIMVVNADGENPVTVSTSGTSKIVDPDNGPPGGPGYSDSITIPANIGDSRWFFYDTASGLAGSVDVWQVRF